MTALVWFKNDLRTLDHPALYQAMACDSVVACYCVSTAQWRSHDMGDRRLAFQMRALDDLSQQLERLRVPLKIMETPWFEQVPAALGELCASHQIDAVYFIDEYPLNERTRDDAVATYLQSLGVRVHRFVADVLAAPGSVLSLKGEPYTVFSPFFKRWQVAVADTPKPLPEPQPQAKTGLAFERRKPHWDGVAADLDAQRWPAAQNGALAQLDEFLYDRVQHYPEARDLPAVPGTSGLSAYLAVGKISVRQCLHRAWAEMAHGSGRVNGVEKWLSEIAWRDFYRHVVALFAHVNYGCGFRRETDRLPWRDAPGDWMAWQQGQTGYPLVDAAMRQLNATGWMHNRLRMVVAMFLTKHLLIDWRRGEQYFMQHLVDGDFPSNNGGWQWSASTGTDAQPYFRIFNPTTQGQRFDPEGEFTRHWVPELADVPRKYLYEPHLSGVSEYVAPIVDHRFARERALAFFKANR